VFGIALLAVHAAAPNVLPSDVSVVYFNAARDLVHGLVPYVDFSYEYPPGSLPVLALAWVLGGHTPTSFVVLWSLLMLGADALIVHSLTRLRNRRPAAFGWIIGVCLVGPAALLRNDLLAVAAFVVAFALTARKVYAVSGGVWAFGALAKVWPAAPLAALVLLKRPGRWAITAGAGAVLSGAALLLMSQGALRAMVNNLTDRQGHRPIEIESSWASAVWVKALVTGDPVRVQYTFGSFNLIGAHAVTVIATDLTLAAQVGCALVPLLLARRTGAQITATVLAWTFALYVTVTLLVAPVLSAQYSLWLLGAASVLLGVERYPRARAFVAATFAVCGFTQLVYPALFTSLQHGNYWAISALLVRNIALGVACVLAASGLRRALIEIGPNNASVA
jgi:hypothetical protein